jgi:hypothetical protein
MTSTAVVPFFKVSRGRGRGSGQAYAVYRCRRCAYERTFYDGADDLRMLQLARHLADAHQIGPLAPQPVP